MALGNVIGSNICNIGLVLGISAFICVLEIKSQLLFRDLPILLLATLVFSWMLMNGVISRTEGVFLFCGIVAYTAFQLVLGGKKNPAVFQLRRNLTRRWQGRNLSGNSLPRSSSRWSPCISGRSGWSGEVSALPSGSGVLPEAVISLTLIAFLPPLPELATSIVASLKKEGDIITGNIIGCLFNLLCVIGVTASISPIVTTQIEMADLYVMIGMTALLLPVMASRRRISRWEGGLLVGCYAAYTAFLSFDRVAV